MLRGIQIVGRAYIQIHRIWCRGRQARAKGEPSLWLWWLWEYWSGQRRASSVPWLCGISKAFPNLFKELTFSRLILAQKDRQLREDTHVRTLQAQASLQKADDFFKVASSFIELDEGRKFLLYNNVRQKVRNWKESLPYCMNDYMETTNLSLQITSQNLGVKFGC